MISAFVAGLLMCSGQTTSLKLDLSVNFSEKVITGTIVDSDGAASEVKFQNLRREKSCMISEDLSFCYSAQHGIASIDLVMKDDAGATVRIERGSMKCQ